VVSGQSGADKDWAAVDLAGLTAHRRAEAAAAAASHRERMGDG
jgi:hypothetical protein